MDKINDAEREIDFYRQSAALGNYPNVETELRLAITSLKLTRNEALLLRIKRFSSGLRRKWFSH